MLLMEIEIREECLPYYLNLHLFFLLNKDLLVNRSKRKYVVKAFFLLIFIHGLFKQARKSYLT